MNNNNATINQFLRQIGIDAIDEQLDVEEQFENLYREWIVEYHEYANHGLQFQWACRKYEVNDDRAYVSCTELIEKRDCFIKMIIDLYDQFIARGIIDPTIEQYSKTEVQKVYETKFARLLEMIKGVCYTVQNHVITRTIAQECDLQATDSPVEFEYSIQSCFNPYEGAETSFQELLQFLLQTLKRQDYRRYSDMCYEQIYTPEGYATHAWKPVCTIKQFILRACDRYINPKQWKNMTDPKDNARAAYNYLLETPDMAFPEIVPNPTIYAARNGIYVSGSDIFLSYLTGDTKRLKSDVVACKYFDNEFDVQLFTEETRAKDYYDLSTPKFQSIFDYQFSNETEEERKAICKIVYAMLGRWLFPIGADGDNFQCTLMTRGSPGTGKSTIGQCMSELRQPYQLACISAMCERVFGLWEYADSFGLICYETSQQFAIPVTIYNSMVCGEKVSVPRKGIKAISLDWLVPMLIFGNVYPFSAQGTGSAGAARRTLVLEFMKHVVRSDPKLKENIIKDELLTLLVKCCRARLDLLRNHGGTDIWELVPKYFHATKSRMDCEINPLNAFVESSEDIIRGDGFYMPQSEFIKLYHDFCKVHGYRTKANASDYFPVFQQYNIQLKQKQPRPWPPVTGQDRTCIYLEGITLAPYKDNFNNNNNNNNVQRKKSPHQQNNSGNLIHSERSNPPQPDDRASNQWNIYDSVM